MNPQEDGAFTARYFKQVADEKQKVHGEQKADKLLPIILNLIDKESKNGNHSIVYPSLDFSCRNCLLSLVCLYKEPMDTTTRVIVIKRLQTLGFRCSSYDSIEAENALFIYW